MLQSPPSRRRGLKSYGWHPVEIGKASPPSRRRGLKFILEWTIEPMREVASFSEAWIEIHCDRGGKGEELVASFSEAWIEIV